MNVRKISDILCDYPGWSNVVVERSEVKKTGKEIQQVKMNVVLQNVKMIFFPRSNEAANSPIGRYPEVSHIAFCDDCDIRVNDEIVCHDKRYRVIGCDRYQGHHLELYLKELR